MHSSIHVTKVTSNVYYTRPALNRNHQGQERRHNDSTLAVQEALAWPLGISYRYSTHVQYAPLPM